MQIFNYGETISELWNDDFLCKGRNYGEGTEWEVFLIDLIEFRTNKIELQIFLDKYRERKNV